MNNQKNNKKKSKQHTIALRDVQTQRPGLGTRIPSISICTWISKNPRISTWISMIFGCQSSIIHTIVDIHIDIQAVISRQGHSTTGIRKQ